MICKTKQWQRVIQPDAVARTLEVEGGDLRLY